MIFKCVTELGGTLTGLFGNTEGKDVDVPLEVIVFVYVKTPNICSFLSNDN
jgi:hypothetical protein